MKGSTVVVSAADELSAAVEAAWAHNLGIDDVRSDTNFFELGGDSLAAMMVIAEVQESLGIAATVADLLDAPTPESFVRRLAELRQERGRARNATRRAKKAAPLTRLQAFRWRHRRTSPDGAEISWIYRVDGELDVDALGTALDELLRRHEILRTTFRRRRGRVRQVVGAWRPGVLRVVDMTGEAGSDRERAALNRLIEEDYRSFDYRRGPLIRATLVKLGRKRFIFSLACSEMVIDGSSRQLLTVALGTLYELARHGTPNDYPYPPLQFGDFAAERRRLVNLRRYGAQIVYWKEKLRSRSPELKMPGYELSDVRGASSDVVVVQRTARLSPDLVAGVDRVARSLAVSPFTVLMSSFVVVLHALSRNDEPIFTTTIAHRDVAGADQLIGAFYNNVFMVVPLHEAVTGSDVVLRTAAALRESFTHSEVPIDEARRHLPPEQGEGIPVHQIRFQLNQYAEELRLSGVTMRRIKPLPNAAIQMAMLLRTNRHEGIDLEWICHPVLPRNLIDVVVPSYQRVLKLIVDDPSIDFGELVLQALPPRSPARTAR